MIGYFKQKKRLLQAQEVLPYFMDLVSLAVSAGDDWINAIRRVTDFLPPSPLISEWRRFLHALDHGLSRGDALQEMCVRLPLLELKSLNGLLLQSMELGTPLAPLLLAEARQMREERLQQLERKGVVAGQKLLFPILLCILPSIFIIIFSPLIIRWTQGGLEAFLQ